MARSRSRSRSVRRRQNGRGYGSSGSSFYGAPVGKQSGGGSGCAYRAPSKNGRRMRGGFTGCPGHSTEKKTQRDSLVVRHSVPKKTQRGGYGGYHKHKDPKRRHL